jgi:hypothetical protein
MQAAVWRGKPAYGATLLAAVRSHPEKIYAVGCTTTGRPMAALITSDMTKYTIKKLHNNI